MKVIIFDLDETLVDRTATVTAFLENQHERFRDRLSCPKASFIRTVLHHQKNGYADKRIAYANACEELNESVEEELYRDFRKLYGFQAIAFPGVSQTLTVLAERHRLAIVSNGSARGQNAKIDSCGIRGFFDVIKISEEFGAKKPCESIYLSCLSDLGQDAKDCLFVGDNPFFDVDPPKRLGMTAVWIRNDHYPEPALCDAAIDSVADILPLLNQWSMPNQSLEVRPLADARGAPQL
jgi:putative hydrolase of the HAD superfamily